MNKGFTIFFAMLVAALALSIGLAIYDLTVRELALSATATQSQYAIYAADTGAECALYWDAKAPPLNGAPSIFGTSTPTATNWPATGGGTYTCNNLDITTVPPPLADQPNYPECSSNSGTWCISVSASAATTTFSVTFLPSPYCAIVQVAKHTNASGVLFTIVNARGYNTCAANPARVERALQVTY